MGKPLVCKVEEGALVIRIDFGTLAVVASNCEYFWDGDSDTDTPTIKVTDPAVFAKEVCAKLNEEEEDGSTLVTDMIDRGMIRAVEYGCLGVDHEA